MIKNSDGLYLWGIVEKADKEHYLIPGEQYAIDETCTHISNIHSRLVLGTVKRGHGANDPWTWDNVMLYQLRQVANNDALSPFDKNHYIAVAPGADCKYSPTFLGRYGLMRRFLRLVRLFLLLPRIWVLY